MKVIIHFVKKFLKEEIIWIASLFVLFFSDLSNQHFSLCLNYFFGIDFCFGCGIGRSISLCLHGKFLESFQMHSLGLFATLVLIFRISQLTFFKFYNNKNNRRIYEYIF